MSDNLDAIRKILSEHHIQGVNILKKRRPDLILIVNDLVPLMSESQYSIQQKIHFLLNGLKDFPRCKNPKCRKRLSNPKNFKGLYQGYSEYCNSKCSSKDAEVQDKMRKTNLKNNGSETYRNIEKAKYTSRIRYGRDNIMKTKKGYEKYVDSLREKYNVANQFQREEVKDKARKTKKTLYGDEKYNNGEKSSITKSQRTKTQRRKSLEKYRKTCLKKYGTNHPMKTETISKKSNENRKRLRYCFEGDSFDTIPELCYYVYCRDIGIVLRVHPTEKCLTYCDSKGKRHTYYPDFFNVSEGKIEEIKGSQFFLDRNPKTETMVNIYDQTKNDIMQSKMECMRKNGVRLITFNEYSKYVKYVRNKYGNDFIRQCELKRKNKCK